MSNKAVGELNIGELLRSGLVLRADEAVAIIYEVFAASAVGEAARFPQVADELWLSQSGDLRIGASQGSVVSDCRVAAAGLLSVLLPPPSELPEYTVAPPLRSLADRLRASAEAGTNADPHDLMTILRRFVVGDRQAVLQQLVVRANAAVDHESAPSPAAPTLEPESAAVAVEYAPLRPPEAVAAAWSGAAVSDVDDSAPLPSELTPTAPAAEPEIPPAITADTLRPARPIEIVRARDQVSTPRQRIFQPIPAPVAVDGFSDGVPNRRVRSSAGAAAQIAAAVGIIAACAYAGYDYTQRWRNSPSPRTTEGRSGGPAISTNGPSVGEAPGSSADASAASPTAPSANASTDSATAAVGAQPLPLPVADGAFSPSFAPGGRALFFHSGRSHSRLLEADLDDRGAPSNISAVLAGTGGGETATEYHVRPSPDGRLIAFDSDRGGDRRVYVANRDGSDARAVSGSGYAAVPSWSPDMKWLAFVRADPQRPKVWNLWLRDLASGELTQQTSYRSGQIWGASWFPDGRRLCYSHEDRLVILDLASASSEVFSTPRNGRLVRTPAVSPDGRRIVFQVYQDGVWMLDLQSGTKSRILNDATAEEFAWDPGGQRIAYHSHRDGQWRIWMITPPRS